MTFDWDKIEEGKREFRKRLAALPIVEKLAMLDALRTRELAIRGEQSKPKAGGMHENPPPYKTGGKKSK